MTHAAAERGGAGHGHPLALSAGQRLDGLLDALDGSDPEVAHVTTGLVAHEPVVEHPKHASQRT